MMKKRTDGKEKSNSPVVGYVITALIQASKNVEVGVGVGGGAHEKNYAGV